MILKDSNPNMFKDFAKDLRNMDKVIMKAVSQLRNEIHERTLGGKDYINKAFRAYNETYKDYKMKKGRSGKVNLSFFGNMLNSMKTSKIKGGGKIHFLDTAENDKAVFNEDMGRKFFDFNDKQEQSILTKINKAILNGK